MKKIYIIGALAFALGSQAQNAGALDTTFGTGGQVVTSISTGADKAYGIAIQSDGKIIAGGMTTSAATGKDFALVRYNTNGSLDTTFGTSGIVTTDVQLGSDDVAYAVALQADGKILLGGYSDDGSQKKAALVRYNSDGTLDTSFGTAGKVLTPFEGTQGSEIKVIKIHALTGNIIVGGNTLVSTTKAKPVVARYTSAGALDTTFNTSGIRLMWISSLDAQYFITVEDLQVQTNGKITAVGWRDFPSQSWNNDHWAGRINSNGTMDTTFDTDGVNNYNGSFNGNDRAYSMLLKSDNSLVVAGSSDVSAQNYAFVIFEVALTGALGSSATQASVSFNALHTSMAYGMLQDTDGKYVLVGSTGNTTARTFALSRINANYTVDTTFDTDGKVTTAFGTNAISEAYDMALQADHKILAAGYTGNDFAIARYSSGNDLGTSSFGKQNVSLYPNPSTGKFTINDPENALTNEAFAVYTSVGQKVAEGTLSNSHEVELTGLSDGLYFIQFASKNVLLRFVKN